MKVYIVLYVRLVVGECDLYWVKGVYTDSQVAHQKCEELKKTLPYPDDEERREYYWVEEHTVQ